MMRFEANKLNKARAIAIVNWRAALAVERKVQNRLIKKFRIVERIKAIELETIYHILAYSVNRYRVENSTAKQIKPLAAYFRNCIKVVRFKYSPKKRFRRNLVKSLLNIRVASLKSGPRPVRRGDQSSSEVPVDHCGGAVQNCRRGFESCPACRRIQG